MEFPSVPVSELHKRLSYETPLDYPLMSLKKPLSEWKMELDDSPIFRYLYRNFKPQRHLEFGTWQGHGALYCLEECDATVFTINLPFGETLSSGVNAYGYYDSEKDSILKWAEQIGLPLKPSVAGSRKGVLDKWFRKNDDSEAPAIRTDSLGYIGRKYLERDLGHRVSQIYCDSRNWDISNYPQGFFDSVLIDGGHAMELISNDTAKAFQVVRPGGLVMWHDFCPDQEVLKKCSSPREVVEYVKKNWTMLNQELKDIFWVDPSWILIGIRK